MILEGLDHTHEDLILAPNVGEDCGAVSLGEWACVLTTDPITGAKSQMGKLGVHVAMNDIASSGARPLGIMVTLLAAPEESDETLVEIMKEIKETCKLLGIAIIGGHTERTDAVNRTVLSITAMGKVLKDKLIKSSAAQAGDYLYMTKSAGLEGTAILAREKRSALLEHLSDREFKEAANFINDISVLPEGELGAAVGVHAMHDVTEGGVLGAIYELCEAAQVGCKIYHKNILRHPLTEKICDALHLFSDKLIGSGSMLMSISPENAGRLEDALSSAEIPYSRLGILTESLSKKMVIGTDGAEDIVENLSEPDPDELYRALLK